MKTVFLLGDSIRQNYDLYVKQTLKDKAYVYYPNDNCMFTQFTLRYLHDWYRAVLGGILPDIVHFNCGLWDVLRLSNEDDTFNDIETYTETLSRIVERILHFSPDAEIIFATTTPVQEPGFTPGREYGCRKNSDIKRFNEAAIKMFSSKRYLNDKAVAINDLYRVAVSLPNVAYSDEVHFDTELGKSRLGDAVVGSILPLLE